MKQTCRLKWVSQFINPVTRCWEEALIRKYCYPHDAAAILQIKLPNRQTDDFLAWHPEATGVFSVRSAYRLGLQAKILNMGSGQCSSEPAGDRSIWNLVWKANVPQKIRVFAWRLATDSLAVAQSLNRRIPKIAPTCSVCGMEGEDAHHAMVRCTLARGLRFGMRDVWQLPNEETFRYTGKDWFFNLLDGVTVDMRTKVIFLLWRSWHHRNNVVHGDGKASITASISFLQNYKESLGKKEPALVSNGKAPVPPLVIPAAVTKVFAPSRWCAPDTGWIKVNVDAGWNAASASGGIGMVARDANGKVLYSEWKRLNSCASAEEAEILAVLDGLRYLAANTQQPGMLESDCARVVEVLSSSVRDQSGHWYLFLEAKALLNIIPEMKLCKVARVSNGVAHELAQLGKRECGVLHGAIPSCALDALMLDCKNAGV